MTMKYRAITPAVANKINRKLGLETWENDGQRTYWVTNEDESGTNFFDSSKERKEFLERMNKIDI